MRRIARRIAMIGIAVVLIFPLALFAWLQTEHVDDGKVHLRYMTWGTPQQQKAETTVLQMFEAKNPNIAVDCVVAPGGNYIQKLQLMLASRTEPDVYRFTYSTFPQYSALGYFQPLDSLIAHDPTFNLNDIVPPAREQMLIDGRTMGLNGVFSGRVIFYNKKLFAAAHLPDPHEQFLHGQWDFSHFLTAAQKLSVIDPASGLPTQMGLVVDPQDLYWILWNCGGDMMTRDGQVLIDQPKSIDGMQFYADLEHKFHVIPQPSQGTATYNFEAGNVGMKSEWAGGALQFRSIESFDWDVVPTPSGPAGRFNLIGGNATILSPHSMHPAEAWTLLKFMTSAGAEAVYCGDAMRRAIPTHISELNDPSFLHASRPPFQIDTFLAVYQNARRMPVTARWNDWQDDFNRWMERMMTDDPTRRVSPRAAAEGMARDIRRTLARPEDD